MSAEQTERDTANAMVGLYEVTRKAAKALLDTYTYEVTDYQHDPIYEAHRQNLRHLILLCETASDALVVDYGG